ncbi:pentatricopeptide repeat-containing protein At1g02150 [Amborella trichopoda]|uniref:pentatricopeptide repeat-containing protein At1g02150 n=1 Tax=Amborella trichopoda TaxID=13333 RepID=UPI0005D301F0|nr:pentatricopeptide repeat-containing protein At1g02150 [Amborella trichopoda]|eukprot:XP_011621506.1 pentatricopeptide repeat-containing protein At1g02150 [Amborella trichopoda]
MHCQISNPIGLQLPPYFFSFCNITHLQPINTRTSIVSSASISQVHNYGTVDFERKPPVQWNHLYKRISLSGLGSGEVLEEWMMQGRKISKWELRRISKELRKFRRFYLALQVYEWMISKGEKFTLSSSDIAIQLDLVAKVHGMSSAEDIFVKLSDFQKNERTYGAILHVYSQSKEREKAETIFEKMKKESLITNALPFNEMMNLYMSLGEYNKVDSIVQEMKDNATPFDIYSYHIWICTCGAMMDVEKMERVLEEMTQDKNVNPNWTTHSTLATLYIKLGLLEKAEHHLKEVEQKLTGRDRHPYNFLISLYGKIGDKEGIYRIWNLYKSSFQSIPNSSYYALICSLVKVGDVEGAEEFYKEWEAIKVKYDPRITNFLMASYVRGGLLKKAEELFERASRNGGTANPSTWEILAEGYTRDREIGKALHCLNEAASVKRFRRWAPKPVNVEAVMKVCEETGDVENVEQFVELMRSLKCLNAGTYKSLVKTYAKAGKSVNDVILSMEKDEIAIDEEMEMLLNELRERV